MKRSSGLFFFLCLFTAVSVVSSARAERAGAIVPVILNNTLNANDDGSTSSVPLNIGGEGGINFFGQSFTQVFVNNNGNLTFQQRLGQFTPNGLSTGVGQPIIAPFFADVDTRGEGSGLVMYGNATVNGYAAFVANYIRVGYFGAHTDKVNSFQVILLDRADTGAGNFDIELNYDQVQWETGDASGGSGGRGGVSAAVGYSNGLSESNNVYFQLPGSLVNGALLDGGPNALIAGSMNSSTPGRYVFQVRNGVVMMPPPEDGSLTVSSVVLGTIALGNPVFGSLSASGGRPPYSWTPPASLPAGLTASGGRLSGTPTQPGPYTIALTAFDSAGTGSAGSIRFSVFGLLDNALPAGVLYSPYFASLNVAGGTGPYLYSFSGLPAGLSGSVSGVITGAVTTPVSTNVSVTVTDGSSGSSVSKTLPLTISVPPPLRVSSSTLPPATMGQTYSQILSGASGGAPPYTWSLASGSLPDGMSLRAGGTISGLATRPGTYTFGVRATDVTGASAAAPATLTIAPVPLTLVVPTLPAGMATVEFPSQTISAQGGVPPYTFSVTGTPPAGLRVDSNGTISGTPGTPGNYSFTVTTTDSAGNAGSATLALTVRPFSTDLVASAGSVDFSLTAGSVSLPPSQVFTVQSSSAATVIPYSITISPASADWLSVSPAGGSTPGSAIVSLNSKALALPAATTPYQATLSVTCLAPAPCQSSARTVVVNLSVKNLPPQLNVLSDLLSFSSLSGGPSPAQTLGLQNAGGGSIGLASVSCAASWCSVGGVPGSISAGQTAALTISADPTALTSGYYRTLITVRASTGTATVPVTLFVSALPDISLQPAGAQFLSLAGGVPNGRAPSFLISVAGSAPVSWTASVLPGADWLSVLTPSGTASSAQPGQVNFALHPTVIAGLAPQKYYGT
ncbi:MAG: putative Ig domain-containing protein, partial [Acidobacteriota bacterium]